MNTPSCPNPAALHDAADRVGDPTSSAAVERHVLDCAPCRDVVRSLRLIDRFATVAAPTSDCIDEAAVLLGRARARALLPLPAEASGATISSRAGRFGAAAILVAACILVWSRSRRTESPLVDAPAPPAVAAPPIRVVPRTPAPPPPTFEEQLDEAFESSTRLDAIIARVERLLTKPAGTSEQVVSGALRLTETAGPRAEAAVHRILRLRAVPFSEAESVFVAMRGEESTRALAVAGVSGRLSEAGRAALRGRSGAIAAARAAAAGAPKQLRVEAALLVADLGGEEAVEPLAQALKDGRLRDRALGALCRLGSDAALLAVARSLPPFDPSASESISLESAAAKQAARSAADVGPRAAQLAERTSRASDRRRLYVLAGMSGDASARPALERALLRQDDAAAAFAALGDLGAPESVPAIVAALRTTQDRSARRRALEALAELPGTDAAFALTELVLYPFDRRAAVDALVRRPDGTAGLIAALVFSDVAADAFAALRERRLDAAPRTADATAWARWWRSSKPEER